MSRRNLEAHERAVAAVNAREVPDGLLAPGFRMENRVSAATDYVYRGERGWREWLSDLFESFAEGASYVVEEIVAAGEDFVAARFLLSGTGARTHEPLELRWVGVTWFKDGKAVRAIGFSNRREALRAVGLLD